MQERIIHSLRKSTDYLSGEEISRALNISRAGIWKYIEEFRRQGYEIDAIPRRGYRIRATPDKLLPWEIKFDLGTKILGHNIIYKETIVSTMDEAVRLGIEGAAVGTIVCAESQTKGRGRLGREWVSPLGKGIYASLLLRPKSPLSEVSQLTLVSAVAICEALRAVSGVDAKIKWPNDILIGGKKVAGILTELNAEMDRVRFVVIGFGINVNTLAPQLPAHATSLKLEAKKDFLRVPVVQEILRSFEKWLDIFEKDGFVSIRKRWKDLSFTLGQKVKFIEPSREIVGVAFDLAPDGSLLLRQDSGDIVKKNSGDALHLSAI
ncbi:MAG: biotin--[acetyl-CoA-carboxylase] ligase [Candidatus Omnitrophica bacterium]|nr:biotin--[acetyl-CoA-carboxylase] ligase [Candidatus Omnitrophota bacterium]